MPPADPVYPPPSPERAPRPTRRDPAWLWILAGALLVARVATGVYEERHPPTLADLVPWVPAAEAPARARATGRPILYDFSADWCGPCQRMRNDVFADEKHASAIGQLVVPVHVVDRQQEEGRNPALVDSLERAHGVRSFPTLVIVDATGRAIDRIEGYPGARELVTWVGRTSVKARLTGKAGASFSFP
ncbi:MAG TPA: thioredoxin family protein [Candidatus Eisenbacteria bacterium]|jgi:thiol:disulfide interchange protein